MRTADFDYDLPPDLIAQTPATQRDESRLLILNRASAKIEHRRFPDLLDYLRAGDVLVLNNSRVIPARLRGVNARTNGAFEILLLEENAFNDWWAMLRPGKRARIGTEIVLTDLRSKRTAIHATVLEKNSEGHCRLRFSGARNIAAIIEDLGEVPLPPYINRSSTDHLELDRERYQTVFAQSSGSIAAPTAGLHFTQSLLDKIKSRGVHLCFMTLHVGLGTFAPVKTETLAAHPMHEERFELSVGTAQIINHAKREGRRVIAVGTTTTRVLETLAIHNTQYGLIAPTCRAEVRRRRESDEDGSRITGKTRLFIYPPYNFQVVDALLTNFHLARSTLLMLVSAFAAPGEKRGRDLILAAYAEAIRQRYRFFSYGDAMLIL